MPLNHNLRPSQETFALLNRISQLREEGSQESIDTLTDIMDSPSEVERMAAALALGGLDARSSTEVLCHHLQLDPSSTVRARCAIALSWISSVPHSVTSEALIGALSDDDAEVVISACIAIGRHQIVEAIEPLKGFLWDSRWRVRINVFRTLLKLGYVNDDVLDGLLLMIDCPETKDYDEMVRQTRQEMDNEDGPLPLTISEMFEEAQRMIQLNH